jgi:hypothetical protein
MSEEKQDFLRRWSRLKKESALAPAAGKEAAGKDAAGQQIAGAPVPLPPLDSLNFESDFKAFMQGKVEEGVKRAALKKLFADPRFNVMDGLDTYIDDYSIENPIPDEMMARLDHARQTLFGRDQDLEETKAAQDKQAAERDPAAAEETAAKPAEIANSDGDPAQDPKAL